MFKQTILSPPRVAGTIVLGSMNYDYIIGKLNAWMYSPGQRRVRKAPEFGFDAPGSASDGITTVDEYGIYSGSPERYDWKIIEKKELYVPYNNYKINNSKVKYKHIIKPGHLDQNLTRYELHRMWVLEGSLKKNMRHLYKKRIFYIDEDSSSIVLVDTYDKRDQLWRVTISNPWIDYEVPMIYFHPIAYHDLQSRRYLVQFLISEKKKWVEYDNSFTKEDFTPSSLRQSGKY